MTDLEKCQELIALFRRAMMATVPAMRGGLPPERAEYLLWDIGQGKPFSDRQTAALDELERKAGYIAGPDDEECYP